MSDHDPTAELMPFTYEHTELRSFTIAGEPWFVAADALGLLDLKRSSLSSLDDDEKGVHTVDTLGGPQSVGTISESGFYSLILRSRKHEAKAIKRWLTREVLPAIRKTGSYGQSTIGGRELMARALLEAADVIKELETGNAELAAKVEADAPKVEAYESFLDADGTYSVGTVAKMLGTSQNKLFAELRGRGVLIAKGPMRNTPYQKYMQHFTVKAASYTRSDGTEGTSYTPRIRPSGVDFARRRLAVQLVTEAS